MNPVPVRRQATRKPRNRATNVAKLVEVCSLSDAGARQLLDEAAGNVERAIELWLHFAELDETDGDVQAEQFQGDEAEQEEVELNIDSQVHLTQPPHLFKAQIPVNARPGNSKVVAEEDSGDNMWEEATGARRKASSNHCNGQNQAPPTVQEFLATFKTSECSRKEHHDRKRCPDFHQGSADRRRNPYIDPYLSNNGEGDHFAPLNELERLYHPDVFRTQMCFAFAKGRRCAFADVCAQAHSEEQLQSCSDYQKRFAVFFRPQVSQAKLADFVFADPKQIAQTGQHSVNVPKATHGWQGGRDVASSLAHADVHFSEWQNFVLEASKTMWDHIRRTAETHMCKVERRTWVDEGASGIRLTGNNALDAEGAVLALLHPLPDDVAIEHSKSYPTRIVKLIQERLTKDGQKAFTDDSLVQIQADTEKRSVLVRKVVCPGRSNTVNEVFARVKFWVQQEGYDEFVTCAACCDDFNPDQGVQCPKGHFFCVAGSGDDEDACFQNMLNAQLPSIKQQEGYLLCPVCQDPFDARAMAARVTEKSWEVLQDAIVEVKAAKRVEQLQLEFDQRLQRRMQEFLDKYGSFGSEDGKIKLLAEQKAAEARNTILNLACPSCSATYAEFEGCMALQCERCKKFFCAYCHKPCTTGRGAHEHVRDCESNLTTNGSYYAEAAMIKDAQRRHRIRKLKPWLRSHKQREQNAIIAELQKDLTDLGIDPAALFNFGNLQAD